MFRWFVGLGIDHPAWDATVFTKNRDRLLDAQVAAKFMAAVLAHRELEPLLSSDHFSVDGTPVEAWASLKRFHAKDGSDEPPSAGRNGARDFHGEKPTNDTHSSTTDPDAKLYRKSSNTAAKLSYIGHAGREPARAHRRGRRDQGHQSRRARGGARHDRAARSRLRTPAHTRRREVRPAGSDACCSCCFPHRDQVP